MGEFVEYEVDGRIATATLNRPERLNAMNTPLINELVGYLEQAADDPGVHVAIVQGAGRAFSTGYEIGEQREHNREWSPALDRDLIETRLLTWLRIPEIRLPIIAKVHGYCIAGATQLASICDVTFAAEDTRVGSGPQLPLGAGFVTAFWAWHIGPKRAKRYAFPSGEFITGTEAAELGLFNEAVPADQLDAYVLDYAQRISLVPKDVLVIHKLTANRIQEIQGFRSSLRAGAELDAIAHFSPEVERLRASARELGVRGAIDAWRSQL